MPSSSWSARDCWLLITRRALQRTRSELERRLRVFANLPVASLDRMSLQIHLDELGRPSE